MTMKTWKAAIVAAGVMCMAGGAQAATAEAGPAQAGTTQAGPVNPDLKQLTRAVEAFLADHGDLCLAMYTWPRDVTFQDQQAGTNEAVQMPVLERLGVVRSVEVPATGDAGAGAPVGPTKRYSLTDKGNEYYLRKKRVILNVHSQPEEHDADFCVAHLTLNKVVRWSPPEPVHGHLQTVVRYTYNIKAAPFLSDPEARKVFPMVARIVRGAGILTMTATVQLEDGKWVPVLPGQ